MSGFEVLGAISGIITILDTVVRFSEACRDVNGIPSSMRDAHARLPLVIETLNLINNDVRSNSDPDSYRAMNKVLKVCEKKATCLKKIFRACIPPELPKPSLRRRLTTAALMTIRVGRSRKIDSLMKGILEDIQLLADNRALSETTRCRIRESTEAMIQGDWRRDLPFSLVSESVAVVPSAYYHDGCHDHTPPPAPHPVPQRQPSGHHNHHHGTGTQYFHIHGGGILNINSGQSPYIVGTIAGSGGFPFPTAANL